MKWLTPVVLLALPFSVALGAGKDPRGAGPVYDPETIVTITAIVTDVREIPQGDPLEGVNLMVKVKGEPISVYVAPVAFVKQFSVTFKKNDVLEITGSTIKFEGADLILAREITVVRTTMVLRDRNGRPFWLRTEIPTGD
jgi:hypothetical protein